MYRNAAPTRLDLLRTKRDRLLEWPRGREKFGEWWDQWSVHHSRWGCASAVTVSEIEARCRLALPDEYRSFVTEISNGGLGPGCGMFSVQEAVDDAPEWTGELSAPFCYGDADARRALELRATQQRHFMLPQPNDGGLPNGCLLLAHTGCGCFDVLVVTGEQRGKVWFYDTRQLAPLSESGKQVTFLDWYESWLDGWLKSAAG